jgi:hypothetical protein
MLLPPLYLPHPGSQSIVPTDSKRPRTDDAEEAEETEKKEAYNLLFGFYKAPEYWDEMTELERDAEMMRPSYQMAIGVDGESDARLPTRDQIRQQIEGESAWFDFKAHQCRWVYAIKDFEEKLRNNEGSLAIAATPEGEVVGVMSIEDQCFQPAEWGDVVKDNLLMKPALQTELLKCPGTFKPWKMREEKLWFTHLRFFIDYACTGGGDMRPKDSDNKPAVFVGRAPALGGVMQFMLNSMSKVIDTLYVQPTAKRMIDEKWGGMIDCWACPEKATRVVRRLCHYDLHSASDALPAWKKIGFMPRELLEYELYKPVFGNNDEIPVIVQPTRRSDEKMKKIYG